MTNKTILATLVFSFICIFCQAQKKSDRGDFYTEEIPLESFDKLNVKGVFNVYLQHSNEESLLIETNRDKHDLISVDVVNGRLNIGMKNKRHLNIKKMNLYINYKSNESMHIDIVGNVIADDVIEGNHLDITLEGVGNSSIIVRCDDLDAEFSRVGNIELAGSADNAYLDSNCTGNLSCEDLTAQHLKLRSNQIGNIKVFADQTLDLETSGVGNVSYSGDAKVVNLDATGVGKVRKH